MLGTCNQPRTFFQNSREPAQIRCSVQTNDSNIISPSFARCLFTIAECHPLKLYKLFKKQAVEARHQPTDASTVLAGGKGLRKFAAGQGQSQEGGGQD